MIGQSNGFLDFVQAQAVELAQPILAKLQAQVGLFLADKDFLLQAQRRAPTPELLERAQTLYAEQLELEGALRQVLPGLQGGQVNPATVAQASLLYARLTMHRDAVNDLRRRLGISPTTVGLDWTLIAIAGGGALALLGIATRRMPVLVAGAAVAGVGFYQRRVAA